jgi:tRNA nucleotidyltransferase (CCA-adding enzyme)
MIGPMDLLTRLRDSPGAAPLLDALAGETGVHVVGGAVRDVLLARRPRELDFVVEGDASAVARRAAAHLGGEVTEHPAFGTATVRTHSGIFDVAASRSERYAHPGALPTVRLGVPIEQDLSRRDFTVNTLAVSLADGRLTEVDGASRDLRDGVLRVLHDRSFVDDPTRLLRLARYEARLGFKADADTDDLARAAIAGGLLGAVSGHRVGDELRLLSREPLPAALDALHARGLGEALLAGFELHALALEHARDLLPPDGREDLLALASTSLGVADLPRLLDHYEFPARDRDTVVAAATRARQLARDLDASAMVVASRLARRLRSEAPETIALAGALGGSAATGAARRWLSDLRHVSLDIDGEDILAAGLNGPAVGVALQAALDARLDGRARTPEEQLAVALASAR